MALVVLIGLSSPINHTIFHSLHPLHIWLSATVTTALYRRYGGGIWAAVAIGLLAPGTRPPHAGHALVSTWASLFYLTAYGVTDWLPLLPLVLVVLFFAVWIPCCTSDIVFPLLFRTGPGHY
jgi:hypothetical protein